MGYTRGNSMGFIDNIRLAFKAAPKNTGSPLPMVNFAYGGGAFNNFLNNRKQRNYLNEYSAWTYACINTISDSVGEIEFTLKKGDKKKASVLENHPILDVLYKPNPYMTKFDLMKATRAYLDLEGNAFWYIVKDGKGKPIAVWPLRPDLVKVIPSKEKFVGGYLYTVGHEKYTIPAEDVLHFKEFNPIDPYRGLSVVQAAISAIDADSFAREWNAGFFANSARPDVILESPDALSPEDRDRLLSSWKDTHGGSNKGQGVAVIWGGLKATILSTSAKDMDFVESRRFTRDEIFAMFRMPKTAVGIVEDVNYASALTTNYVYATRCIKPRMAKMTDTINEFFIPMFGESSLNLSFVDPTPQNREQLMAEYTQGLAGGWLTINEVRAAEGRPDVEGGDVVMVDFSKNPLGGIKPQPVDPEKSLKGSEPAKEFANELNTAIKAAFTKVKDMADFEDKGIRRKGIIEERASAFEPEFKEKMADFLDEQKKRLIDSLSGEKAAKIPTDIFDEKAEVAALAEYMKSTFETIFSEEGNASLRENDIDFTLDMNSTRLKKVIAKNTKRFAHGVTKTTSDAIRTAIGDNLADGASLVEIKKAIEEMTDFDAARAEMIARTEVITTQNMASVEAWKESGVVTEKIWFTAEDERTCPFCDELHGKTISVERNFVDKGGSVDAVDADDEDVSYDTDYRAIGEPALHPNCRCVVLPVIKEGKTVKVDKDNLFELYQKANDALKDYGHEQKDA